MSHMEEEVQLRSEDIEEILGTPPNWLLRWGTTVLVVCMLVMLWVSWVIQYPDVVPAKITLTTTVPPIALVARTNAYISKFLVKDNQSVSRNDVLVVLQSNARYEDVRLLDEAVMAMLRAPIDSFDDLRPHIDLELGDIESDYTLFVQNVEAFQTGSQRRTGHPSAVRPDQKAAAQLDLLEKANRADQVTLDKLNRQLQNARDHLVQSEKQLADGLQPRVVIEQERGRLSDMERQYSAVEDNVKRRKEEIFRIRKSLSDTRPPAPSPGIDRSNEERVLQSLSILRKTIDKWKQTYLISAPTDGNVSFNTSFYSAQQYVREGNEVLSVVPPTSDKIVGRIALPVAGSGKVRPKQRVVIRLESYPHYEFGTIEGLVESKSLTANNNQYAIVVSLPKGLKTQFGRTIPFEQQLQGEADIVTEERRFLQRILDQLFVRTG